MRTLVSFICDMSWHIEKKKSIIETPNLRLSFLLHGASISTELCWWIFLYFPFGFSFFIIFLLKLSDPDSLLCSRSEFCKINTCCYVLTLLFTSTLHTQMLLPLHPSPLCSANIYFLPFWGIRKWCGFLDKNFKLWLNNRAWIMGNIKLPVKSMIDSC